jgi:uncharacterized membrane protein YfcA
MQDLITYLLVGSFAGFQAGLLGVGGGMIIVPVLIFTFALHNFDPNVATHMAVATSLATIAVTSISSVLAHNKHGNVNWGLFKTLTPGLVVGVWLGVNTALSLSGQMLQICFGIFALAVAAKMATGANPNADKSLPGRTGLISTGVVIGWASAIFGIGGGTLTVPFLRWRSVEMKKAVATSAACGLPIAIVGALTNALKGLHATDMPQYSLGYVYIPALFGIVATSAFFAKLGAKAATNMSQKALQNTFVGLLALVGVVMIIKNLIA